MDRKELLKDFFVTKDYKKLKNILSESNNPSEKEILARIYLEEKKYSLAASIYEKINMQYEYGR